MRKRWGNDEHEPGGDPSWLGGRDRGGPGATADGAGSTEARPGPLPSGDSTWSSDFGASGSSRRADQDFGSGPSGSVRASQHSAPRFGDATDDRREGAARQHEAGESGSGSGEDGARAGEVGKALLKLIPTVVFLVVFIGFFAGNDFFRHGASFWWIAFVILVPQLVNLVKTLRK